MSIPSKPSLLARALLSITLPAEIREEILGDLEEQYHSRSGRAPGAWYWRQALVFALRFAFASCVEGAGRLFSTCAQPGWTQDLRQASRSLSRSWAFSATVVLIMGLGLGAATAIFSVYYGILLRPFPYQSPDTLVRLDWMTTSGQSEGSSLGDLELWRRSSRVLSAIGVYSAKSAEIYTNGQTVAAAVTYVSPATLQMLGVNPQIGRLFTPAEDIRNGDVHKAILSHSFWQHYFGGDPGVLGRVIRSGERSLEVVGVMPIGFGFPNRTEIWIPVESYWATNSLVERQRLTVRIYPVIARLNPHVTLQQAQEELKAISIAANRKSASELHPRVRTLRDAESGQLRPYLTALFGGVGCLALICIANVSNLQLARGAARHKEFALRVAIGASAARNVRTQLLESLLLGLFGALIGSMIAALGVRAILHLIPPDLPFWIRLEPDAAAFGFCLALSVAATVLSGLIPAWRASGQEPIAFLRARGQGRADRAGTRKGLVIAEIGLSTMLLVSALLMMQTLLALRMRDPGFRTDGLLTIKVTRSQPGNRADRARAAAQMHQAVLERLGALPGVVAASASTNLPFTAKGDPRTIAELTLTGTDGAKVRRASFFGAADIGPEYFATMGIPLLRGRSFTRHDDADSLPVVMINERAATTLWPNQEPLGQRVTWGTPRPDNPPATIVGVVGNVRNFASEADKGLEFYYPYFQYPVDSLYYVIRTSVAPESLIPAARRTIQEAQPSLAVSAMKSMPQWIDESLWQTRLWSWLLAVFAGVALVLAAAGLYGVVTYLALLRSREMVIRISLGATSAQIAGLMFGGMLQLVGLGIAAGVIGSLATSKVIGTLLFQVSQTDSRIYLTVAMTVAGVALLACWPPIRRASHANPASILKEE